MVVEVAMVVVFMVVVDMEVGQVMEVAEVDMVVDMVVGALGEGMGVDMVEHIVWVMVVEVVMVVVDMEEVA